MKECREAGKKSEEGAGDEEEEGTDEQRSGVEHKGNGNGGNGECPASKTRSGTVDGQGRTTTAPGTSPRAVSTPSPIHDPAARSRRRIARPAPPPCACGKTQPPSPPSPARPSPSSTTSAPSW